MNDYEKDVTIAQSCNHYRTGDASGSRYASRFEGVSCSSCRNWNGAGCAKNMYENVATRLGID